MRKKLKKKIKTFSKEILYNYLRIFNPLVKEQRKKPNSIPVIIINFNQLHNLKNLVSFFLSRKIENIVIIDINPTIHLYWNIIRLFNQKLKLN